MNKTIYVLGELNVDMIMTGDKIEPEWNKEKLVDSFSLVLGSSSAITACALAGLGLDVRFVGVVGDDLFGRFCIERLKEKNVNTNDIIIDSNLQTGTTLSLSTSRDRALLTYMGAISKLTPEHLPQDLFEKADHIHFGSYYLQDEMREHWKTVFKTARQKNITTSFDTGWDPSEKWYKDKIIELLVDTDLFLPSKDEFEQIFPSQSVEDIFESVGMNGQIALKCGYEGAKLVGTDGCILAAPYAITPIDTTGAGDSFNAGMIYGLLSGMTGIELIRFANACGALATLRIGGASTVPSVLEVVEFMIHNQREWVQEVKS